MRPKDVFAESCGKGLAPATATGSRSEPTRVIALSASTGGCNRNESGAGIKFGRITASQRNLRINENAPAWPTAFLRVSAITLTLPAGVET
jgi:hypothetical protein